MTQASLVLSLAAAV